MVGVTTEACIEGFPRSGNTFATTSFELLNPATQVAHHVHVPGQLLRAVRLQIPTAVLIRHPVETVASISIYFPGLSPRWALARYIDYYRQVKTVESKVVVIGFDQMVVDPAVVPRALNARFGSAFRAEHLSASSVRTLRTFVEGVHERAGTPPLQFPLPHSDREVRKAAVRDRVEALPRMEEAVTVFRDLAA